MPPANPRNHKHEGGEHFKIYKPKISLKPGSLLTTKRRPQVHNDKNRHPKYSLFHSQEEKKEVNSSLLRNISQYFAQHF